jgi:carbamoyl-phosphate synthase large subunit
MVFPVKRLADLGFEILATEGTAEVLHRHGVVATVVRKHYEPDDGTLDAVQRILAGEVDLIVNTPFGVGPRLDGYEIRTAAVTRGVPCITTVQGLAATVQGIEALAGGAIGVLPLQEYGAHLRADARARLREEQRTRGRAAHDRPSREES